MSHYAFEKLVWKIDSQCQWVNSTHEVFITHCTLKAFRMAKLSLWEPRAQSSLCLSVKQTKRLKNLLSLMTRVMITMLIKIIANCNVRYKWIFHTLVCKLYTYIYMLHTCKTPSELCKVLRREISRTLQHL